MMKRFALLALSALLSACASPPGSIPDSAFGWQEITVASTAPQVFRSVMERDRRCGDFAGALPDGQYYPDLEQQRIDLFIGQSFGHSSSGIVSGRIDIAPEAAGTRVRVGVRNAFGGEREAARWARFVADPSLSCEG
jgi:hypothetical protein